MKKKIYISVESSMMIFDHELNCASWGDIYYYLNFKKIEKYWHYIGDL